MSWNENLGKVLAGQASKVEFVDAVTRWLYTDIAEYTEGRHEAISRRAAWVFPNDYVFSVGSGFTAVFYPLEERVSESTIIPIPGEIVAGWEYVERANGWGRSVPAGEAPSPEEVVNLLEKLAAVHGEPELVLPWGYMWTESIIDQGSDYYEMYDNDYDDPETDNPYRTMFTLASAIVKEELVKFSPWKLTVQEDEMSFLSEHSHFMLLDKVFRHIDENNLMILDLDQHCAGCSSGTYEWAVKNNPALEGKAIFRTWGQNSQFMWLGDGSIYVEAFFEDDAAERVVKQYAYDIGLLSENPSDTDWEPSSGFYFES